MTAVDRLIEQLRLRGLGVIPGGEPDQLLLTGPRDQKTPEVIAAVKAFKPQLLDRLATRESRDEPEPVPPEPEPP